MKNFKLFIVLAYLTLFSTSLATQTYSGGSGTEADPYLISSKADMATLATAVNNGTSYSGKFFLLTQDITEVVTTIIGTIIGNGTSFKGTFDGGGHSVNVSISSGVNVLAFLDMHKMPLSKTC
jgi:hypothetical protein